MPERREEGREDEKEGGREREREREDESEQPIAACTCILGSPSKIETFPCFFQTLSTGSSQERHAYDENQP